MVGAGFAGASLIRNLPPELRRSGQTLLVDRADKYAFVPLIHEVAVGRIHPDSVVSQIPPLCDEHCGFLQAEASDIDLAGKTLNTAAGPVRYEYLILAAGSGAASPPDHVSSSFQPFWKLEDALRLRDTLSEAWRQATAPGAGSRVSPGELTVAIVGGGATGVELSAEVAALFDYLRRRTARPPAVAPRVVLYEAEDRLMGWLDPFFHEAAMEVLTRLGVEVRLGSAVEGADEEGIRAGDGWMPALHRVWAAGIEISDPVRGLSGEHDRVGRVEVDAHLTLPEHPEVYVLGDAGIYEDPKLGVLPPTASVAVQQGPWVARDLARRLQGRTADGRPPFGFFNRGYVVSLGPESAVGDPFGTRVRGPAAQALYRSILLYYLKSRRDRVLAASDWAMERTLGRVGF